MAWAILKGLHAPALVSRLEVDVSGANGSAAMRAEKCRVANLKYGQGTLRFDRTDDSLPMPVDRRAEAALKLAPVLHDLNRYSLKVTGLTADRYELTIDGEPAGTASKEVLSKGYNLATCAGPIAKQTQQVLALVFQKNDLYFQRWRNVQLGGGAESRLRELDKQISDLEAEIDRVRIPKEHHFELKPSAK